MKAIDISRAPARATGPRTEAGKTRSSQNAVKHGLTSRAVVLANEDPAAWRKLLDDYVARFQPADSIEAQLVEQMAAAQWRIRRAWALETATLDLEIVQSGPQVSETFDRIDQPTRTAIAHKNLTDNSRSLAAIQRHEARLAREYHRALGELRELQADRKAQEESQEPPPDPPAKANLQNELPSQPSQPAPQPVSAAEKPSGPSIVPPEALNPPGRE
ncbi:MAG: hypothetical protein U0Q16_33890 [Bryobacteraceae bacterium]